MTTRLLISAQDGEAGTTVSVQGDIDAATVDELRDVLRTCRKNGVVVIDLAGVPFIDSSGLGALVQASRAARDAGGQLRVENAGPAVARAAQYAGLTDHLGMPASA